MGTSIWETWPCSRPGGVSHGNRNAGQTPYCGRGWAGTMMVSGAVLRWAVAGGRAMAVTTVPRLVQRWAVLRRARCWAVLIAVAAPGAATVLAVLAMPASGWAELPYVPGSSAPPAGVVAGGHSGAPAPGVTSSRTGLRVWW